MNSMNICFSSDNNYAKYLAVTICSVIETAANDDFLNIFVIDDGISEENKSKILKLASNRNAKIEFIKVASEIFDNCYLPVGTNISKATFYRLLLPTLFPELDKILYLDCDMVVTSGLSEFYNRDISNYYVAGALDEYCPYDFPGYINAGATLFNLIKLRKDNIQPKFVEHVRTQKCGLADQDAINFVCKGNILAVEQKWNNQNLKVYDTINFNEKTSKKVPTVIIHFMGRCKPWQPKGHLSHKWLYYHFLNKTEFATFKTKYLQWIFNLINSIFCIYYDVDCYRYRFLTLKGRIKSKKLF